MKINRRGFIVGVIGGVMALFTPKLKGSEKIKKKKLQTEHKSKYHTGGVIKEPWKLYCSPNWDRQVHETLFQIKRNPNGVLSVGDKDNI